jgi:hypothetical protein
VCVDGGIMSLNAWLLSGYILFVGLNLADLFLTKIILENGGKEWNFFARYLYNRFGIKGIFFLKCIILFVFGVQYFLKVLDIYVILYLDFVYFVIFIVMCNDSIRSGFFRRIK